MEVWQLFAEYYNLLEKNNKITAFKNSLVCQETFDRIANFVDSYQRLCDGEYLNIIKDIRADVTNAIKAQCLLNAQRKKSGFANKTKKKKQSTIDAS